MEEGRPYCGNCGYNERFGPPAGDALAKVPPAHSSREYDERYRSQTPNAELTANARESLKGRWEIAIGTFFLYFIIVSVIGAVPFLGSMAMAIVAGPFALGLSIFTLNLSRGTDPEVEQIFQGFSRFGVSFSAYWLVSIYVLLWSLLLIVPGIIKAFAYALTLLIIADDESVTASQAISRSQELMRGNKLKLFQLGCRFIGWGLLSLLTFGVGFLWLAPYAAVSVAKFYDDVRGAP